MKELKLCFLRKSLLMLLFLASSLFVQGQTDGLDPITRTYVIKNANIIQGPGRKIDLGSVVIKNGVIQAVGKNVIIPVEAHIIEADSMYIYAGFIEGLSHTGVPKPADEAKSGKLPDPGNPPNDLAGIQPQRNVRNMLGHNDKSIDDMRRIGFTAAHVVPHGRMLPGKGAIILLSGNQSDELVYKGEVSFYSQLSGAPGMYPNTVIGVMAKYRELYRQANQAKTYQVRYAQDGSGLERPRSNRVLEAFYPVIDKQIPVVFKAQDVLEIQRVLSLQKELGFDLMLAEVKQGWDIADKLKSSGTKVFLSLDLPELEKKEEEKTDSVKTEGPKKEKTEVDLEEERLKLRKEQMIDKYYTQPALMTSKGIQFGFSTLEVKNNDIKANLANLVEKGLSEDAALAALTTSPAQLLGLSSTMGTVDIGKMANLVITDISYFDKKSKVKYVFVDGKLFEYKDSPKVKGSDKDSVDVVGTWTYTTETPQGVGTGDLIILGKPGDYSGTISSSLTGDTNDISDVSVDGDSLTFSYTMVMAGETIFVTVVVVVKGNIFEGTMTAGQLGSFPIKGERIPKK